MRNVLILITSVISIGCGGTKGIPGPAGIDGKQGPAGVDGKQGQAGKDGKDGTDYTTGLSAVYKKLSNIAQNVLDVECDSGRGTGTKLADGNVLTALHVIKECKAVYYYSNGKLVGTGGEYRQAGTSDVAYISKVNWTQEGSAIPGVQPQPKTSVTVGDVTFTLSLPGDLIDDVQITLGFVADSELKAFEPQWNRAFTTDAAAAAGSSGAPVFDSQGNLFGIHVGGWNEGGLELNVQILL
jgi:S1-C subfamily serine protease